MAIRLVPLREADLQEACQYIVEGREWSPKSDIFLPPIAVISHPDSRWLSALNGDELVGVVGFHNISWPDGTAEMFTSVVPKWRGSGASLNVVKEQLDYGFLDLGLRKITMTTLAGSPSAKIADKMKVPLEGTLKRSRLKRGVYYDALVYGLERT
jgi:RimJ/RimL family protein N-acetyltransferase